ncbi:hypothetical protein KW842_00025 [Duganella sp. sic0402]|uniref:hypothetical protein n=1 Tax=Duganella sp. sic0402 TaxID=2854786 RepID=UPI001C464D29|nr:hypothetical protein [Duganella sp. sic0402]MBV7534142.1 hypothetical protein [Duganella sp. sic0402]
MKISFRRVAILTAVLFLALALTWMFAPQRLLEAWGLVSAPTAEVLGRRAAALYAGVAAMFWLARNAVASPARTAMSRGLALACFSLAALGIFELVAHHVTTGILPAVIIEVALGLALLQAEHTLHIRRK